MDPKNHRNGKEQTEQAGILSGKELTLHCTRSLAKQYISDRTGWDSMRLQPCV